MTAQLHLPVTTPDVVDAAAGERAKAAGAAEAVDHTPADWATECDAAIATLAATGLPFQAADLVRLGLCSEPDHPNRWGGRFSAAATAGVITHAGVVQSTRATVHRSLCRSWVGTAAAQAA